MEYANRFFLAVALTIAVSLHHSALGGDWSVWDAIPPLHQPAAEPALDQPFPVTDKIQGRRWLPDLKTQTGRLRYIMDMYAKAEDCLDHGDATFTSADLRQLQHLYEANVQGLSRNDLWSAREGLMHTTAEGTAIRNASCSEAKTWQIMDLPDIGPAETPPITP